MFKIFFILLIVFIKSENDEKIFQKPGISQTKSIKYLKKTKFTFSENKIEDDLLQVNIYPINCNIRVYIESRELNEIAPNIFSTQINTTKESISIDPIVDILDGKWKENYEKKNCYLSINSYYIKDSQTELEIDNKEENIINLDNSIYHSFKISYEIKNISDDSFLSLNFRFEENSFKYNISYLIDNEQVYSKIKSIDNSTNIYLNSEFLVNNEKSIKAIDKNRTINIIISNYKTGIIHFKIIEKNSICLLERNALNFGFLTTKTKNQYYYTEIFNEEEGELILHNKRFYGELYGKIIIKDETNKDYLNISKYPFSSNDSKLEYSPHYLKLKYNYTDISHCFNGCYLLITYQQYNKSIDDFPSIGYEFTILSRTWDNINYLSEIIDMPFNEFIISCFEQKGTQNHYYAIYVPNEAEEIIIEIESNYLDFFFDEGRVEINTINPKKSTKKIIMENNKAVFSINTTEFNLKGKHLSFALKPKIIYNDILSFYYFRVLHFKKNETKYYPIDSYLGNLCKPEFNNDTNYYYCNFILRNDYNESNTKFAISSTNQYEHFKIYISKIYPNEIVLNDEYEFRYINNIYESIDYYIFQFEFTNDEIKSIISTYEDKVESTYPQIYSAQMFYISGINQTSYFKILNHKYYLTYQYIYGNLGSVSFLNIKSPYHANRNFIGIPVTISIDNGYYEIKSEINSQITNDYIYYSKLIYNNKSNGIDEIKLGEPKNQIINTEYFPIYFYLNLSRDKDINIIVNIRLQNQNSESEDNIEIKGYLLNDELIRRKQNGEYIEFPEAIHGYYSSGFNIVIQKVLNIF